MLSIRHQRSSSCRGGIGPPHTVQPHTSGEAVGSRLGRHRLLHPQDPAQPRQEAPQFIPGPRTFTSMQSASTSPCGGVGAMADTRRSAASRCCCVHCRWSVWSSRSGRTTGSSNYVGGRGAESHVMRGHSATSLPGVPRACCTHAELLGLKVLVPPLVLVVIHESAI